MSDGGVGAQALEMSPGQAADRLHGELVEAGQALAARDLDAALDAYVRGLGLALQLGPAATEIALGAILAGAADLLRRGDGDGLCALGPAVAGVVDQAREAGAVPPTAAMQAWAGVAVDVGALLGQVGLALALPVERRAGLWRQAQARAALLDEATGGRFALTDLIGGVVAGNFVDIKPARSRSVEEG
ncbi:MAG: hypothetical protein ACK2UY_13735 [Anaerolineae bacterium]